MLAIPDCFLPVKLRDASRKTGSFWKSIDQFVCDKQPFTSLTEITSKRSPDHNGKELVLDFKRNAN